MKLTEKESLYLRAKEAYYEGNPIIEDAEFDILEAELKEMNSEAIKMVGFKTKGVKYNHLSPMKSLDKIQFQIDYVPFDGFIKWLDQNPDNNDVLEATAKFDGNAVNLIYKAGKLIKAITRGDGVEGQDVTDKLRHRVPQTISIDKELEIRGEVVILVDTFDKKYGPGTEYNYKNARNFVAGMLNKDQLEKEILQDLDFLGFEIKMNETTWMAAPIEHLKHWGFINIFSKIYKLKDLYSQEAFEKMFETFTQYRKDCPYQLDGWVMKFGNNMRTPEMEKDHHPKWAMAVKFPPKVGRTRIIDVEWNLGTTGVLVPTGILEPVDLDGSTVQRVTLYNHGWAAERDLGIGAEIEIVKSGDIIPKVHNILSTGHGLYWPLTWEGHKTYVDDIHLRVENYEEMPEFKILKMHGGFVALGMKGIGLATTAKIYTEGLFETIHDIFSIKFNEDTLIGAGKFVKGRELEILLNIVKGLKEIEEWKVINSLKISGNGRSLSKQLSLYFSEMDYDFSGFEKAVVDKFMKHTPELKSLTDLLNIMEKRGIEILRPAPLETELIIGFYELTGTPKEHGFKIKSEFIDLAENGGFVHSKLDKNCNFLITDNLNAKSSKMKKAEKLGVEIITYSDFATKYLKK